MDPRLPFGQFGHVADFEAAVAHYQMLTMDRTAPPRGQNQPGYRAITRRGWNQTIDKFDSRRMIEIDSDIPQSISLRANAGTMLATLRLGREGAAFTRSDIFIPEHGYCMGVGAGYLTVDVTVNAATTVDATSGWGWPRQELFVAPDEFVAPGGFFDIVKADIPPFAVAMTITIVSGDVGGFGGVVTWIGAGTLPPQGPSVGGGTVRVLWIQQVV